MEGEKGENDSRGCPRVSPACPVCGNNMEGNNPDKELLEAMPSIIPRFAVLGMSILAVPVIPTAHPKPNSTSRKLRQKCWKFKSALIMAHVLA